MESSYKFNYKKANDSFYYCKECNKIPKINFYNKEKIKISHCQCKKEKIITLDEFIEELKKENEFPPCPFHGEKIRTQNLCLNCSLFLCSDCLKNHIESSDDLLKHKIINSNGFIPNCLCQSDNCNNANFFCFDCKLNICNDCRSDHKSHSTTKIEDYLSERNWTSAKNKLNSLQSDRKEMEKNIKKLIDSKLEENKKIYEFYNSLLISYAQLKEFPEMNVRTNLMSNDISTIWKESNKTFIKNMCEVLNINCSFLDYKEYKEYKENEEIKRNKENKEFKEYKKNEVQKSLSKEKDIKKNKKKNSIIATYKIEDTRKVSILYDYFDITNFENYIFVNNEKQSFDKKKKFEQTGNYEIIFYIKEGEKITSMAKMFYGCTSLINLDLSDFDSSEVTTMSNFLFGCSKLISINLKGLNTEKVTNMDCMFYECNSLQSIDLSSFKTNKVKDMTCMFRGCEKISQFNLSHFDTSNVQSMKGMFSYCTSVENLDLSNFDTTFLENMKCMFNGCRKLRILNLEGFDVDNVNDCTKIFSGCDNLDISQEGLNSLKNLKDTSWKNK